MKRTSTAHVAMAPQRCIACWKCIDACPKGIIGKSGRIWHTHVIFKDAASCTGCCTCIRTCQQIVFYKVNETPSVKIIQKILIAMERMLPLLFIASAITGINLHTSDNEMTHGMWINWDTAHTMTSLLWLLSAAVHLKRICGRNIAAALKTMMRKKDVAPVLTITFTPATMTGVVLTACGQDADSSTDIWNFNLGALLVVLCSMHIIREKTG